MNQKALVGWVLALSAINWGLYGVLGIDLVAQLLGGMQSMLAKLVYGVIGLVGVYKVYRITMGGGK